MFYASGVRLRFTYSAGKKDIVLTKTVKLGFSFLGEKPKKFLLVKKKVFCFGI